MAPESPVRFRHPLRERGLTLDVVLHTAAFSFDAHRLGMVQQPIQDRGGQGTVMVEDCGPLLQGAVGGTDDRPLFIAQRDDLEEQIGARLVNREVPKLVEDQQRGLRVFFAFGFETPGALCGGEGVEHLNGTGKKPGMALEAGGIAQGGRQMRFALRITMPSWG